MNNLDLHLSTAETNAVLAALPLALYADFDTSPEQKELNANLSAVVMEKLLRNSNSMKFTANETRIICACVGLAKSLLTGEIDMDIDADLRKELSRHYFTYCSLLPRTEKLFNRMDWRFSNR